MPKTIENTTTEDLFLGTRVRLLQPLHGYRAATDPVLLAASVPARKGQCVLDVGCGVGAASFCLGARVSGLHISGIDLQAHLIELAHQNVSLNNFECTFEFVQGDLLKRPMHPLPNSFDHVMANPPFYEAGSGRQSPYEIKAIAHMAGEAGVSDWVDYMLRMLKPRGTFTMINRAERLEETLSALKGRVGELVLHPLWSMSPTGPLKRGAKRFILQGRKGIKTPMRIASGFVIHDDAGAYMPEIQAVLMDGSALDMTL